MTAEKAPPDAHLEKLMDEIERKSARNRLLNNSRSASELVVARATLSAYVNTLKGHA